MVRCTDSTAKIFHFVAGKYTKTAILPWPWNLRRGFEDICICKYTIEIGRECVISLIDAIIYLFADNESSLFLLYDVQERSVQLN